MAEIDPIPWCPVTCEANAHRWRYNHGYCGGSGGEKPAFSSSVECLFHGYSTVSDAAVKTFPVHWPAVGIRGALDPAPILCPCMLQPRILVPPLELLFFSSSSLSVACALALDPAAPAELPSTTFAFMAILADATTWETLAFFRYSATATRIECHLKSVMPCFVRRVPRPSWYLPNRRSAPHQPWPRPVQRQSWESTEK